MNVTSMTGSRGAGVNGPRSAANLNGARGGAKRRDRTLVFRLSQEEYESLVIATSEHGGRSVSDFIRTAVMATVENGLDHKSTPTRLGELEKRVRKLETAYLALLKEGA